MLCPICQSQSSQALVKDNHTYYRCPNCNFLFHRAEERDSQTSAVSFYDQRYWESERLEALRREKEDAFVRALELLYLSTIPVTNILDFGCGLGCTVRLLRDKLGLNTVGVDISADFEETDFLHRCDLEDLSRKYPSRHFDAIYSIEVFEHLDDPKRVLTQLCGLLKPAGKILINTGTQEYISEYDPEMAYIDPLRRGHISIYSLKSLSKLASTVGYSAEFLALRKYAVILASEAAGSAFPHPDNLQRLRLLGDWFPALWQEYMRLVFLERDFDDKARWVSQLLQEAEEKDRFVASLLHENETQKAELALLRENPWHLAARSLKLLWRQLRRLGP